MNADKPKGGSRVGTFAIIVSAIAAIGGLLFGFDTGIISGAILFIKDDFVLSPRQEGAVVASVLVGSTLGAFVGGILGDCFGRRRMIILAAMLFGIGSVGTALAQDMYSLWTLRLVVGLGIGIASFISPLYIAEMAPPRIRGGLVFLNQLAVSSGILIAYFVNYLFADMEGGWRWMLAVAVIPAVFLGVGMWLMKESPRWLIAYGYEDQGRAVLRKIRDDETSVEEEIAGIRREAQGEIGGWSALLRPDLRRPLVIGVGLAIFQQVTGINTVIYYAPTILQNAGVASETGAILGTVGVGVVNVLFTLVGIWLVDRYGRRALLLVSLSFMALSLALIGYAFQSAETGRALGLTSMSILMLYVAAFAIGLGPIFWLLISEIYPVAASTRAMSVATIANWGANWLVAVTFPPMTERFGQAAIFWIYAMLSVFSVTFAYFLVPETKGKSLEQIQDDFKVHRAGHTSSGLRQV